MGNSFVIRRDHKSLRCICLCLLLLIVSQNVSAESSYLIGLGSYDITGPAADVNMMGYANMEQIASGVHFRLRARAFIVAEPGGSRVVFVNLDACMASQIVTIKVIERLKSRYGGLYDERNVAISGIHTHAGPGGYLQYVVYIVTSLGFVQQSFDVIVDGIEKAIIQAHENLRPGSIFINRGELLDAGVNRSPSAYLNNPPEERKKYKYDVDKEMTLLKFVDKEWGPVGSFNWFATHGTSMSRTNSLISGDNKGAAARFMEDWFEKVQGETNDIKSEVSINDSLESGFPRKLSSTTSQLHDNCMFKQYSMLKLLAMSFPANNGSQVPRTFSTTRRVRSTFSQGVGAKFVSAFCQSNCGDVSPNVLGAFCIDMAYLVISTTVLAMERMNCVTVVVLDEFESTRIIGDRQYKKAVDLFTAASEKINGKIDYHHTYLNFSNLELEPPMVLELLILAKEMTREMHFGKLVRNLLKTPSKEQIDCQLPKPILWILVT
ncbi:hypothetical protein M5K25_019954 [Dendrobium thyrsiflorum]|uniref:Neutral ceramidase n=1 Tax=Dendrobium thyrsiflorum TaxID=117978 RepID=A0ABD0UGC9_DENTH